MTLTNAHIYTTCNLTVFNFKKEAESQEYKACTFTLNGKHIVCREAKITPKKTGQFVTFWKRNIQGTIEPFSENDSFDFFVVHLQMENQSGQFVFPKAVLHKKGILSTKRKKGKLAFRVYPIWDNPTSKQATKTQRWQLNYFYKVEGLVDCNKVLALYNL